MNESKLRFKDDDGSEFPDWEEKSVGDITIELKEYEQLNSGYPLMTWYCITIIYMFAS